MKWYQLDIKDVERKLHVFTDKGLSHHQVEQRRKQFGFNAIQLEKKQPIWILFVKQFQDFMVLILLGATLIAGMLGEYIDAIAIMTIVLLNGFIGFFQEQKAEKSLEKLKELSAPKIRVFREGEWKTIPSEEAVVGDVIRIRAGDRIPADIRIVQSNGLETEESTLTGESIPVEKTSAPIHNDNITLQDQINIGFKSTLVTKGHATGIVIQTGMNTAIGQIASLMVKTEKVITPLELKLIELGKVLIYVVFLLTALTVGIGIYHGQPLYDMVLAGVSLAVAVIPEGLPAIVTVALSLGVQRMIKRKAIVRKLSAVETLGCASVICTDKTGTITENKMTVKEIFINDQSVFVTGEGYDTTGEFYTKDAKVDRKFPNLESMLVYGLICNGASLFVKKGKYMVDGDPTDGALLIAARKIGLSHLVKDQFTIIKQFPFDSTRKRMSVIVEDENNRRFLITKGAPEMIVPRCSFQFTAEGRQLLKKNDHIENQMNKMADKALRIIAISIKPLQKEDRLELHLLEKDLTFVGLFGLMDPPRKEVKKSIEQCKAAGIKTVMITGDHKKTAIAIAKEIGLQTSENDLVLEGHELNNMDVNSLGNIIERIEQQDMERIVAFEFKAFNEIGDSVTKTLMVEIMGRHSNVLLLNEDKSMIINCLKHVPPFQNRYRTLLPGAPYKLPPSQNKLNILEIDDEQFIKKLDFNEGRLDRQIVNILTGVSPMVAKEVVHRAHLGSEETYKKEFITFQHEIKTYKFEPTIYDGKKEDFHVIPISYLDNKELFDSANEMVDEFFSNKAERDRVKQQTRDLERIVTNELNKNKRKLKIHQSTIKKAKHADTYQKYGELLTAHMHLVRKGDKSVTVVDYYDPDQNEITIELQTDKTPSENAQLLFKKYRKLSTAKENAAIEINKAKQETNYLEQIIQQIESARDEDIEDIREELREQGYIKKQVHNKRRRSKPTPEQFTATDGTVIYVGRNNKQNEYVTHRLANKNDIWLHTLDIPGSHVVIKHSNPSEQTLLEAAQLAAYYSKAQQSSSVPVDYTEVRHVKKPSGAKPGFVTYSEQKTLYVTPEEAIVKKLKNG